MKMKNIKKLIASTALSASLVFGAVSTASAYQYEWGDFTIGIMGTTVEMAIEMGAIAYESPDTMYDIPVDRYDRLFNVDNVGDVFSGDTLSNLQLVGYMGTTPTSGYYRGYFAVQDGWTNTGNPDTMLTKHTAIDSFHAATTNAGFLHSDGVQGGYVTGPVGDRSIKWGMTDGIYNSFLDDLPQPGHGQYGTFDGGDGGLELLGSGGDYTMNIWMDADDHWGYGVNYDEVWDYDPTKLNYNVHAGVDADGWVYVETVQVSAVPIPGAVWLLGFGILVIMGMRRRNNGQSSKIKFFL